MHVDEGSYVLIEAQKYEIPITVHQIVHGPKEISFLFGKLEIYFLNNYSILAKKLIEFYKNKKPLKNKSKKAKNI